jgi:hypothetical protein
MSRWYDEQSEKYGGMSFGPFWGSRRGKLILLALFAASVGAGMGIAWWAKVALGL